MAFKNFYNATIDSFPFNQRSFPTWWASNYSNFSSAKVNTNDYTTPTTYSRILLGSKYYQIYKLKANNSGLNPTPAFYFFKATDENDTYRVGISNKQRLSDYNIKNVNGSILTTKWKKGEADNEGNNWYYAIKLKYPANSNDEFFFFIAEEDYTKTITNEYSNVVNPIPSSFEIFEPVSFSTNASVDITPNTTFISSNAITTIEGTTYTAYADEPNTFVNSGIAKMYAYTQEGKIAHTWNISVSDYSSIVYSIEQIGSSFKIYTGKQVDNTFLSSFRVKCVASNDYHTEITYPQTSLQLSLMSKTIVSETDTALNFTYNISGFTRSTQTSISKSVGNIIKLKNGVGKYENITCKTSYSVGDVINAVSLRTVGSLTYTDNTTISLNSVIFFNQGVSCSLGALPQTITAETPTSFTITYNMLLNYFGNLQITFNCVNEEGLAIKNAELVNYQTDFNANSVIDFGLNAKVNALNSQGEIVKEVEKQDFNYFVTNRDSRYGTFAKLYQRDEELHLTSMAFGYELVQKACVTYYENNLIVNDTNVLHNFIMNPNSFEDFDYTGLVVQIKKHNNSLAGGHLVTYVQTITLNSSQYEISHDAIDFTKQKIYQIKIRYYDQFAILHEGSYEVSAEPLRPIRIDASGTATSISYYDNDSDTFKLPQGLTFEVVYNDPTYNYEYTDIDTLSYYRDAQFLNELTAGTSVIKRDEGNRIYFKKTISKYSLPTVTVSGYFIINWVVDAIISVELENEVVAYYGNRLKKLKNQCTLKCTYASGAVGYVDEFEFENANIIYTTPAIINVVIIGAGTFELENADTNITWQEPMALLAVDLTNFQTDYNNKVDIIYPNGIGLKVEYYEFDENDTPTSKCDYEQVLTYSSSATSAYDKFTVTGLDDLATYNFGTQVLNLTMSGASQLSERIQLNAQNRFNTDDITTTISIQIIEILDILGIKLLSAKSDYLIGEAFLNETDNTQIMIFYKDTQQNTKTYTCYLRNGLTALNIYPLKGTIFNTITNGRTITITSATNYNVSVQYTINVKPNYVYNETTLHNLVALYLENYLCPDGVARSKYFLVERTINVSGSQVETTKADPITGQRVINDGFGVSDLKVYGFFEDLFDKSVNARVLFFDDYISPIEGANNITVKFPCYVEGNADLINKSHFGIMFGNNNSKNRLFVSGNKQFPNKDWHSSEVNVEYINDETLIKGNYGYFEDLSECVYGETDNAVVGYDIVSNDKLLVLKSHSDKETTVYFRQPQLVTAINGSGTAVNGLEGETLYQEEFSVVKGNNSVAGINPKAITNLNGDTVFVSNEKQVVGLDLTGIIGDNQRYANSRSYFIDEDLKNQDLTNCFLWSNNSYLFVVLPNKVYVAYYELKTESQYEWFVMDVADVKSVIEINNVIYFGNSKGELFKFTKVWKDAYKVFAGYGITRMTVNAETEILVAVGDLATLEATKTYMFKPIPFTDLNVDEDPYIYYSLGVIQNNSSADCDFYVDNADNRNVIKLQCYKNGETDFARMELLLKRISEKTPVFFNHLVGETTIQCASGSVLENAWGKPYWLKEYESGSPLEHLYQVIDENGNVVPIRELYRAVLCMRITNELEMTDINKLNGTFKLKLDGEIIDIVQYNAQSMITAFRGEIIEYRNVEAFYINAPLTMGSLEHLKTIWSFTLSNDSNIPSELELCYASNKIPLENMKTLAKISKDVLGFDIETFNFTKVDFDKNVVPRTYTNKRVLSGVKFLCFGFRNLNDTNSVLSSLAVTYTLPYPSYGSD